MNSPNLHYGESFLLLRCAVVPLFEMLFVLFEAHGLPLMKWKNEFAGIHFILFDPRSQTLTDAFVLSLFQSQSLLSKGLPPF